MKAPFLQHDLITLAKALSAYLNEQQRMLKNLDESSADYGKQFKYVYCVEQLFEHLKNLWENYREEDASIGPLTSYLTDYQTPKLEDQGS